MKKGIIDLFVFVDDFVTGLEKAQNDHLLQSSPLAKPSTRTPGLAHSEIACILLMFQESP